MIKDQIRSYLSVVWLELSQLKSRRGRGGLLRFGEEVEAGGSLGQILLFWESVDGGGRKIINGNTTQFTLRGWRRVVCLRESQEEISGYCAHSTATLVIHWGTLVLLPRFVISDGTAAWWFVALNWTVSVNVPSGFHQNFPSGSYRPVETDVDMLMMFGDWCGLKLVQTAKTKLTVRTSFGSSLVASRSSSVSCRQTGTLGTAPPGGQQGQLQHLCLRFHNWHKCWNTSYLSKGCGFSTKTESFTLKLWVQ